MPSGADDGILLCRAARPLFLVLALQKLDIDFRAVDADKLASAVGQAGRRQQQKELLEIEALNGSLHGKYGVGVRYGIEETVSTPCPVNAHDADAKSVAERHAFLSFVAICHLSMRAITTAFGAATPTAGMATRGGSVLMTSHCRCMPPLI